MSIHQKVLLVDDDVDDQYLFTEALKAIYPTIECMIANNGREAISKLGSCSPMPTLIFLDLNMPLMNGYECMAELKKNTAFRHLPVVVYTTSNKITELKRITEMGAKVFLTKLSNFNILKNELAEIFEMEL
jgi:CheY-like chemotaxis protein